MAAPATSTRLSAIAETIAERRQIEAAGQPVLRPLPSRRPSIMIKCVYAEPARGYALTLFVSCGLDPASLDIVEVFVKPGHGSDGAQPAYRDALMERLLDDVARLVSFHLRNGFSPRGLRDRLASTRASDDAGGEVAFDAGAVVPVCSPMGAIVEALCVAQADAEAASESLRIAGLRP